MREIKKYSKLFISYLILFFVLLAALLGLNIYCNVQSSKPHNYIFKGTTFNTTQNGISILFNVNADKIWDDYQLHSEMPKGAQYDGILKNKS